ncbi:MAG: hypothetical protein ACO3D9_08505 [Ilumatobacteraceae bacterium]|jgi:hypothetical protein
MCTLGLIELRIAAIALICLGAGVALCLYTLRLWKEARLESPALAPLEVMSDDAFVNGDEQTRRDLLQMAREIVTGAPQQHEGVKSSPAVVREGPVTSRRPINRQSPDEERRTPIDPLLK